MKKTLIITLLIAVVCFSFVSCGSDTLQILTGAGNELSYKIENNEAVVTAVSNKSTVKNIVIPDEYEGLPVTKIDDFAAVNLEYVIKVTIGRNVKEISDWAFGNSKKIIEFDVDDNNPYLCDIDGVIYTKDMKTLLFYPPSGGPSKIKKDADGKDIRTSSYVIPEGVETIRSKAFYKCYDLTGITFPQSLISIEEKAFFRTNLENLTLPENLEFIGKDAFAFNYDLKKLTVPTSVRQIDEYAFFCCTSLLDINMQGIESEMTLGKKWYPTDNGIELGDKLVINWETK